MKHGCSIEKKGIGGSDAGSICGLNPYSTAISVFQDKTQLQAEEKADNEAMRQGRDLEEYVARRFTEETGKKVRRANAIFYKEEQPFMLANVDRLIVGENAGLECKTASAYSADKWKDGHIPESYEIQCHHYMAVTGADAWYIACVILGKEFIWYKIERDEEIIQMLIRLETEFWNDHVLANKMPAPDGSKAAEELLAKYYKNSDPDKSVALVGFDEKLKRRAEIAALQDKLDQEKKQIEQEVKVYMEDAEQADSDSFSVSWKSVVSNRVDSKKLKADYPDVYQKCVKTSESRRFTVKEIAEEDRGNGSKGCINRKSRRKRSGKTDKIHEYRRYDQGYGAGDQKSAASGDHTRKIYKDGPFCAEYHSETCRVQPDVFPRSFDECSTAGVGT